MSTPARTARRQSERERARAARRAAKAAGVSDHKPPAAIAGEPDAEAVLAAAAAAGIPPPRAAPDPDPPLTMGEIPPDAQQALGRLLASTEGRSSAAPDPPSKRAKKYVLLERELADLLTFPAGPALMAGDQFCSQHFAVQGPALARQLTIYAESHPSTYDMLVWMASQGSLLVIAMSVIGYLLPPMIHHGLPAPSGMRKHYGMDAAPAREPDLHAA